MMLESILKLLSGATQAQLRMIADKSGVPLPTLIKIKYRQTKNPRVETVEALGRYFTMRTDVS